MKRFLDTNILIYAQHDGVKGDKARAIMAEGGEISTQVLNEFVNVLRKKLRRSWADIDAALHDAIQLLPRPKSVTFETHVTAMTACREVGCAFYDALILASAQESACDEILTEDMQHGRQWGGVTIRNPFLP